jgi:capsular polysaccharide biosynthesis protein
LRIILPSNLNLSIYKDSLLPFYGGIVRYVEQGSLLIVRKAIFTPHIAPAGNYSPTLLREIRSLFHHYYVAGCAQQSELIYISRSKATKRRISNEDQVTSLLSKKGFATVLMERMSFKEQCAVAQSANILISNHGAGLTNMLFMHSGATVMEIRHQDDRHNNCYFTLASALELKYYYFLAEPRKADDDPHIADLVIDINRFREELEGMLRNEMA